jgi:hypothetical protein
MHCNRATRKKLAEIDIPTLVGVNRGSKIWPDIDRTNRKGNELSNKNW